MRPEALPSISLLGMPIARVGLHVLLDHIFRELAAGKGGWLITANLDFLRRHAQQPEMRALYADADVIVADGMPLVWAARLQGDPLPERVAGSSMILPLAERAAAEGRRLYLLGGATDAASEAAGVLVERFPGLQVVGTSAPYVSNPPTADDIAAARGELQRCRPDIVLVGLGSPKQEQLIRALRGHFPGAWMVGVGISFSFIAGHVRRAPSWMRRTGLEWTHRLAQEPQRLARRYLVEDAPFAVELLLKSAVHRLPWRSG
ncbi:MAG: WecB/TagA/CpsF family glycosyltransferase [Myxococcales bacterium]|nr:WecB/TagA/CpsF family glycosyltransferase [Myxococcales bacterium]